VTKHIDLLNIFLILVSAFLAYQFPLELLIFSFAILGPLHYLTEINWLNSKNFFFTNNNKIWLIIGVVASVLLVVPKLFIEYGNLEGGLKDFVFYVNSWTNAVIFATLLLAVGYQFIKTKIGWVLLSLFIVVLAIWLNDKDYYTTMVGLFIPTIIHVYLFTLIFILYGARKSGSRMGYVTAGLLILMPLAFVNINLTGTTYEFSDSLKAIYLENNFHLTSVMFAKEIGISDGKSFFFYETMELRLMMFISFIYLYHYLNWFSKTTVIKWYKSLNSTRSILIAVVWGTLLTLFYIDFRLGFLISFFFSILHVILEFPLNILSIRGLIEKV
jgi:tetrahydromethanopterin S-methyltransferase subunit F